MYCMNRSQLLKPESEANSMLPAGAPSNKSARILFLGKMKADGTYTKLALKQHTAVIVWPLSPEIILFSALFPFADTAFGRQEGTVLKLVLSIFKMCERPSYKFQVWT